MNTISLVLNGRTTADLALRPERQRASITMLTGQRPSLVPSMPSLSGGIGSSRPSGRGGSPGWYNNEGAMTLDDFARQVNTTMKRFERWQGACAHNLVVGLLQPTPLLVFIVFHPLTLIIMIAVVATWLFSSGDWGVRS